MGSRLFAYNSAGTITGTSQSGNLAISNDSVGRGSVQWWAGPNEDLGYVIGYTDTTGTRKAAGVTISGNSVGFLRTTVKTDVAFLAIANYLTNQGFLTASVAVNWLNTNGYYTTYIATSTVTAGLVLNLDAGDTLSYPGSGTTWTDTVGNKTFTLFNNPTYSSNNGGYLSFTPASAQYAASSTSLSSLSTWTIEVWHYYTGNNSGSSPTILTELYPGLTSRINFSLGSNSATGLQNGFFNGAWRVTPAHTLTANNWYHIVGTYDGTTIKLYVNNTLIQSSSYSGTPTSSSGGIRLMRRWDLPDYWGGRLSVVRIYTGDILSTGVTQNWNAQKSRFGL